MISCRVGVENVGRGEFGIHKSDTGYNPPLRYADSPRAKTHRARVARSLLRLVAAVACPVRCKKSRNKRNPQFGSRYGTQYVSSPNIGIHISNNMLTYNNIDSLSPFIGDIRRYHIPGLIPFFNLIADSRFRISHCAARKVWVWYGTARYGKFGDLCVRKST